MEVATDIFRRQLAKKMGNIAGRWRGVDGPAPLGSEGVPEGVYLLVNGCLSLFWTIREILDRGRMGFDRERSDFWDKQTQRYQKWVRTETRLRDISRGELGWLQRLQYGLVGSTFAVVMLNDNESNSEVWLSFKAVSKMMDELETGGWCEARRLEDYLGTDWTVDEGQATDSV